MTEITKYTPPDHLGSITPENIACWMSWKLRSSVQGVLSQAGPLILTEDDEASFLSAAQDACLLKYPSQWSSPDASEDTSRMFFSKITARQDALLLLDIEAIHIPQNPAITTDIWVTDSPVTVQGITGDRVSTKKEGTISDLSIMGYYS